MKKYQSPEMKLLAFQAQDVLATSGQNEEFGGIQSDFFTWG